MLRTTYSLVCICIFLLPALQVAGQDFIVSEQSYGVEEGLPHREVNTILQCSRGFIWVGTPQGISRFDGHDFKTFNSRTDTFQHNNIWRILEDADGWFWLLPQPPFQDFDIWHPVTRKRTTFLQKFGANQALPSAHPAGWIVSSTDQTLLAELNPQQIFTYHPKRGVQVIDLKDVALFDFANSKNFGRPLIAAGNTIWAFTDKNELTELDWKGQKKQQFSEEHVLQFNRSIHSDAFPFVYFEWDSDKRMSTQGYLIDRDGKRQMLSTSYYYPMVLPGAGVQGIGQDILYDDYSFYTLDGKLIYSLSHAKSRNSNSTHRAFFLTEQGYLWAGNDFGLHKISMHKNPFRNYLTQVGEERNAIRGIYADEDYIVLNVESMGPSIINRSTGAVRKLDFSKKGYGNEALTNLADGRIAFGQSNELDFLEIKAGDVKPWPVGRFPWAIFQVEKNTVWLGTESGLLVFDLEKNTSREYEKYNDFDALRSAHITYIGPSRDSAIWVCSNKGLFKVDPRLGVLAQYAIQSKRGVQLPHDVIYHFYEEHDGTLWLGSGGAGLIRLEADSQKVTQFTALDGLSNDVIYAVYPDEMGNLWLSSDQGIMRFNKETESVQTFLTADGLPHNEFNRIAHFQTEGGELFFGTISGATSFFPADLKHIEESMEPPLRITAYFQFDGNKNRMVERTKELLENRAIVLSPDDRYFRLELALLNFQEVSKNRLAYRFVGMDEAWEFTSDRSLSFGRLPYGKYELQIKAQDARGHWSSNELHISVSVIRPFYLQSWFIVLLVFSLLAGVFVFYKRRTSQLRQRQRELEQLVADRTRKIREDKEIIEQQAEELQSLEKLKSRFFANVSHELRTPLSLMIGPLNSILKKDPNRPEKERQLLEFVRNNSQHLLKLVNDPGSIQVESGRMEVKEEPVNFLEFLQPLVSQFSSFSDSESVKMEFDYQLNAALAIQLDTNKFEKIAHNFLSNAIKFSPAGSVVKFTVREKDGQLLICVSDQGPGIHPEDLPFIFDRFYQSKHSDSSTQGGTGIGLSLAAELAALLHGKIWAESELGKGSAFYFQFPQKEAVGYFEPSAAQSLEEHAATKKPKPLQVVDGQKKEHTILIVEDNSELRAYMRLLLEDNYHVLTAENGQVGWEILQSRSAGNQVEGQPVDLILSDLMMPVMDGFELLEHLKGHALFRHIPVIMLTARADMRVKLKALRIGVDDYLTKPFVEEELLIRIQNLLNNYQERVKALSDSAPDEEDLINEKANLAAVDAAWLEEVEAIFSEVMSDSRYNLSWMAEKVNLSERQFNRRLKQLTGLTPNNYLRELRLQRAKDLLLDGTYGSVKEVGYAVGFSSTKYFSNLFQERFGVLPSVYQR
ncbi:MAG: response regulator [Saprospiraceae bacterium]